MASGSDIRAGRAFVQLYCNNSALMRGLDQAQKRLRDFGNGIATVGKWMVGLGTAVAAPFITAAKHFMSVGDQLDKMAARTGLSTNALSELGFAAEQSGSNIEEVEKSVRKMQKSIAGAAQGEKTYVDSLASIGLSYETLKDLTPEQQFEAIARGINGITDPTLKASAAMEIFGKSGTALLPMLGDIEALRAEAQRLGLSIGPEQAKAAAQMEDAWNRVKRSVGAALFQVGASVANSGILDAIAKIISSAREWIEQNRDTIASVLKVAAGVVAAGAGIFAFGKIIAGVGAVLGGLHSFILWAAGGLQMLVSVLGMALSPALLIGAALTAAGAGLIYLARNTAVVQAVGNAIAEFAGGVRDMVATIADDASQAWGGITAALSAGDIGAAIKVVTTTAKLEWTRLTTWLGETWQGFLQIYADITNGIASVFIDVVASVKSVWYGLMGYLTKLWEHWKTSTFEEGLADWLAPIFAKMQGVSVEDTRKALHEDFARQRAAQPARDNEIDAQTKASKAAIEADRQAQQAALAQGKKADDDARAAKVAAFEKELEDMKRARDTAVAAAKDAGARAATNVNAKQWSPPELDQAGLSSVKNSAATVTFSAAAAMGAGGSVQERIAKACERTFKFIGEQTTVLKNIEKNQVPLAMRG